MPKGICVGEIEQGSSDRGFIVLEYVDFHRPRASSFPEGARPMRCSGARLRCSTQSLRLVRAALGFHIGLRSGAAAEQRGGTGH